MFTYLGWLILNLKIRINGWFTKPECSCKDNCNCKPKCKCTILETIIEETDPKYDYNKFA